MLQVRRYAHRVPARHHIEVAAPYGTPKIALRDAFVGIHGLPEEIDQLDRVIIRARGGEDLQPK